MERRRWNQRYIAAQYLRLRFGNKTEDAIVSISRGRDCQFHPPNFTLYFDRRTDTFFVTSQNNEQTSQSYSARREEKFVFL
jgi:hypothetical protein